MASVIAILRVLMGANSAVLAVGRTLAWMALMLMVCAILAQVFFRYVLNNPLPWPEEAARFMMLWMTGLIAPSAYRWGGFVSIDMFVRMMTGRLASVVSLILLSFGGIVILYAITLGWGDVFGFGGRFATASLKVPLSLFGGESFAVPRSWMMASLLLGLIVMASVTVELILRNVILLVAPDAELPEDKAMIVAGAD